MAEKYCPHYQVTIVKDPERSPYREYILVMQDRRSWIFGVVLLYLCLSLMSFVLFMLFFLCRFVAASTSKTFGRFGL